MLRRRSLTALTLALLAAPSAIVRAAEDEPSAGTQLALRFVQGLRDRGYSDLSLDYLEGLRSAGDTPADLRSILDLEEGRSLLEEANGTADSTRRGNLFEMARVKLDKFLREHPDHPLTGEASKKLGRAFMDDGHLAFLLGQEAKSPNEAEARTEQARALFAKARDATVRAEAKLKAAYDVLPKSVAEDDALRDRRDRALFSWVDAQLQHGLIDYEEAQTYPLGDKARIALLEKGVATFQDIAQHHRTQLIGIVARMWQAKCYEERGGEGDFGRAIGIYDELMNEPDPALKPIQRQIDYFRIVLKGRRKDFAAAADDAANWLKVNAKERHTDEGLGVMVELARDLLAQAQAPEAQNDPAREAAVRKASEVLKEVVKVGASRHKPSAVRLLRQVKAKPKGTGAGAAISPNIKPDDALSQADEAAEAQEFDQALALYRAALRKIDLGKDAEKANRARGQMAFCLYEAKRYDESAIVAEHLARGYPKAEIGPKAAEIGMAALGQSYNEYTADDPGRDAALDRLADLADYTAKTWPDTDQADEARETIANVAGVRGRHADAARALEGVRESSPKRAEALARAGASHWRQSEVYRRENKPEEARAEVERAVEQLKLALKTQQDNKTPPTDKDLLANACDLADIYLYQDRPKDALAVLDPLSKAVADKKPSEEEAPQRAKLIERMLRSLIGIGEVNRAIDEMKALEASGGSGQSMAQLYFNLGRLLEKEMATLKEKGDAAALAKTKDTYQKFLDALAASQAGQSYESLEWAGEAMLSLGAADKAAAVFERVLSTFGADPKLADAPKKRNRARMKLAVALRQSKQFDRAQKELEPLMAKGGTLDALQEQGYILEDKAESTKAKADWEKAASHWRTLALRLGRQKTKTADYYDAWYHVALAQSKQGNKAEAAKSLRGIMVLTPGVGGPEMKKKYDELLSNLSGTR